MKQINEPALTQTAVSFQQKRRKQMLSLTLVPIFTVLMEDENDRNVTEEQEKDAADSKAAEAKALDVGTAEAEETDRK